MRGAAVAVVAGLLALAACAPTLQTAGRPDAGFAGPRLEKDAFVTFDGTRLGLTRWPAEGGASPWAVIVAVHGMNAWARAFHLAGPWWAKQGIATLAYDQRGFGRSPGRGIWAPRALTTEDLRTIVALARRDYPHALIAVVGESLGAAVAIEAFASPRPPAADRLVLASPAVWGWSSQSAPQALALYALAEAGPASVLRPPRWLGRRISPSDNLPELEADARDPLMIFGARADALAGLTDTMQHASDATGALRVPTLFMNGAHDQIIPRAAAWRAARRLSGAGRTVFYAHGWHLLMRDLDAPTAWRDIAAFIGDPAAPLPSGAPPIPGTKEAKAAALSARAGL
ncbi:MAG: alpha/beta fold hydrolase [Caulobacteraceae bacterium]